MDNLHPEVLALIEAGPRELGTQDAGGVDMPVYETHEEFARRIALRQQELDAKLCDSEALNESRVANDPAQRPDIRKGAADASRVASALATAIRRGLSRQETARRQGGMMHTAEEVRFLTTVYTGEGHGAAVREMLLAYADLLEEIEKHDAAIGGSKWVAALRQRVAEKARKG